MKYIWPNFTYSFEKDLLAFQKKNVAEHHVSDRSLLYLCFHSCLLFVLIIAKCY